MNEVIIQGIEYMRDRVPGETDLNRKIHYNKVLGDLRKYGQPIYSLEDLD